MDDLVWWKVVYCTCGIEKRVGNIRVRDGKAEAKGMDGRGGGLRCSRLTTFISSLFTLYFTLYFHRLVNARVRKYFLFSEFLIMFCVGRRAMDNGIVLHLLCGSVLVLLLAYYTAKY
ncbi:hypothetical protein HOY82DRAFT_277716 [Tuber indicum]|nr:hypothetical protein HOY82DRAFT_277716 [Tuber indicum]